MRIGLVVAMAEEVKSLVGRLKLTPRHAGPFAVFEGEVEPNQIVLVASGPGKVNAAAASQYLVSNLQVDRLLGMGVAGGLSDAIHPGDIVVARDVVQFDSGLLLPGNFVSLHTAFSNVGKLEFVKRIGCDEDVAKKAWSLGREAGRTARLLSEGENHRPHVAIGTVVTGDQMISNPELKVYLRDTYGAVAVDMESAAIGQVAKINRIPFGVIRAVSDKADSSVDIDFSKFVSYRDEKRTIATRMKKIGAVGTLLVSDPSNVVKAMRLRRNVDFASANVARFVEELLPLL